MYKICHYQQNMKQSLHKSLLFSIYLVSYFILTRSKPFVHEIRQTHWSNLEFLQFITVGLEWSLCTVYLDLNICPLCGATAWDYWDHMLPQDKLAVRCMPIFFYFAQGLAGPLILNAHIWAVFLVLESPSFASMFYVWTVAKTVLRYFLAVYFSSSGSMFLEFSQVHHWGWTHTLVH